MRVLVFTQDTFLLGVEEDVGALLFGIALMAAMVPNS